MKQVVLAALMACVPFAASALSCRPHSLEAAFAQAQADDARFMIVRGRLDFDARKLPKPEDRNHKAKQNLTLIDAKLTGSSLSAAGFDTPYSKPVTLAVSCYGPWCASVPQGAQVLAFVELSAQGNVIATNPCGGYLFGTPTSKMIRAVKSCFAGKACLPLR